MSDIQDHIIELEKKLLEPAVRKSPAQLDALLAEEFVEFGQSGTKYSKSDVVKMLPTSSEEKILASNFQAEVVSPEIVVVTYLTEKDGIQANRLSRWIKRSDTWQMVFHQGTPISGGR